MRIGSVVFAIALVLAASPASAALKSGASGYVLKSVADRDLLEACRAAMRGEPFLYPGAVTALIRNFLDRARDGERLTGALELGPREAVVAST